MPLPTRPAILALGFSLDAEPFLGLTARADIDTLGLGYAVDGEPVIVAAYPTPPLSGWGCRVLVRPFAATGRAG